MWAGYSNSSIVDLNNSAAFNWLMEIIIEVWACAWCDVCDEWCGEYAMLMYVCSTCVYMYDLRG